MSSALHKRIFREARGYAEALIVAFLVVTFVFNTVGVVGASMLPTLDGGSGTLPASLLHGDRVFIPKYETWLRRSGVMGDYRPGDIVVVREPVNSPTAQLPSRQDCVQEAIGLPCRPFLIKRIVAGPGDHLRIEAGDVYLNGRRLDQEHITATGAIDIEPQTFPLVTQEHGQVTGLVVAFKRSPSGIVYPELPTPSQPAPVYPTSHRLVEYYFGELLGNIAPIPERAPTNEPFVHEVWVPEGHYFVMGDNRSPGGSEDSRAFGFVEAMDIAGRASHVIWPPRRDGGWNWRRLESPPTFEAVR